MIFCKLECKAIILYRIYKMEAIKMIYNALIEGHSDRVTACVRKGDLRPLLPVPLDDETLARLLAYAKRKEAAKMAPPYLLSDYLCYMYGGTDDEFASLMGVPPDYIYQSIYAGCYWHDGVILRPDGLGKDLLHDFLDSHIMYGEGKVHFSSLWLSYVAYAIKVGATSTSKREFKRQLTAELATKGYARVISVRIGSKVAAGYKGLSCK